MKFDMEGNPRNRRTFVPLIGAGFVFYIIGKFSSKSFTYHENASFPLQGSKSEPGDVRTSKFPNRLVTEQQITEKAVMGKKRASWGITPSTCESISTGEAFNKIYEEGRIWSSIGVGSVSPRRYYTYGKNEERVSMSGPGSNTGRNTQISLKFLSQVISNYSIRTMMDIPCGDVNWQMDSYEVDSLDFYLGADVTRSVIELNEKRFAHHSNKLFMNWDFVSCPIPQIQKESGGTEPFDLLHVRDVLQHLKLKEAEQAARNLLGSGVKYIISTTYPSGSNTGITNHGEWYENNLEKPPFSFPKSLFCVETHKFIERDHTCIYKLR